MVSNNVPHSLTSKVLEELGMEGLRVVASVDDVSRMESSAGCAVVFSEALRQALQAFLNDRRGSSQSANDSPCGLVFAVPEAPGLPPNPDAEQVAIVLRSYLNKDTDAEIVLLTQATIEEERYRFTPEHGESLDMNWVFRIRLPHTLNILIWAIVDRTGQKLPYAYCIE